MVERLPQPRQELEDVGVVVQQRPLLDEGVEARRRLFVQGRVEVALGLGQLDGHDGDLARRQLDVLGALGLRPAQHDAVEHVAAQKHHRLAPVAHVAVAHDGVHHVPVEVRVVLQRAVPAVHAPVQKVLREGMRQRRALAARRRAVVARVRRQTHEAEQRVQIADAVLQRRAGDAPLTIGVERVGAAGGGRGAALDAVGLIENDAEPLHAVQHRLRQVDHVGAVVLVVGRQRAQIRRRVLLAGLGAELVRRQRQVAHLADERVRLLALLLLGGLGIDACVIIVVAVVIVVVAVGRGDGGAVVVFVAVVFVVGRRVVVFVVFVAGGAVEARLLPTAAGLAAGLGHQLAVHAHGPHDAALLRGSGSDLLVVIRRATVIVGIGALRSRR
mmetsp:Transcript_26567/g.82114  ORF Transcript_26567/g.82114 Transcript_26567/m.82114 type:complete len:386 (-) Transcript_26567:1598-2755(-)